MAPDSRAKLIALLKLAHAGERAAELAYAGHWRSCSDPIERDAIHRIMEEEIAHRACVGRMLAGLGATPAPARERVMALIGGTLGPLCHATGWLLPMLGAAILETRNVKEYDDAAAFAEQCGELALVPELRRMADVELEHESWFKERVRSHPIGRHLPLPRTTRGASWKPARA
jgi:rubrerythrin